AVNRVEVPRAGESIPALHDVPDRVRRKAASGPSRGDGSGSPCRRGWTCAPENRACASGGAHWAGRSASRESSEHENGGRGPRDGQYRRAPRGWSDGPVTKSIPISG